MSYKTVVDQLRRISDDPLTERRCVSSAIELARYLNRLAIEIHLEVSSTQAQNRIIKKKAGPYSLVAVEPVEPLTVKKAKRKGVEAESVERYMRPTLLFEIDYLITAAIEEEIAASINENRKSNESLIWKDDEKEEITSSVERNLHEIAITVMAYLKSHRDITPGELYVLGLTKELVDKLRKTPKPIGVLIELLKMKMEEEGLVLRVPEKVFMAQIHELVHCRKKKITAHDPILFMNAKD